MLLLALFLVDLFVFRLVFRSLSAPDAKQSPSVRIACGVAILSFMAAVTLWAACGAWALPAVGLAAVLASTALQGDGLRQAGDALGKWRFAVYLLSVATLAGLVFLCLPVTTFLTSPGEISLHLGYLASVNARDAMVVVYVAAAVYALVVTPRMRTALALLALGALAVALVYSYALPFGYPSMSGLAFEQMPISTASLVLRTAVDAVAVVGVVFAVLAAVRRFGGRGIAIAILLVDVSLGVVAGVSVLRDAAGGEGGGDGAGRAALQPLRFSTTRHNVLVIFLDRFMGSYVEKIVETEKQVLT